MQLTDPPWLLPMYDQEQIAAWTQYHYPHLVTQLEELWEDCRDYYILQGPNGRQYNWNACFRRWIRRASKPYRPPERGSYERPQQQREHTQAQLSKVGKVLRDAKKK